MADIIDIQVRDQGTTTATKNMQQLGIAADQAAKSTKGLQDALRLVSRGEFQKAKNGLAQASANLAKSQRDAAASASTLSGSQSRALQAEQKLLLARQKVATETARTQLLQAKAATEAQKAATLAAQQAQVEDKLSQAIERRANAQERAAKATAQVNTASQNASRETANFTKEQQKLSGAAEANRMHMVNVSYQLQDIAVGLASGQRPMTVFIQQGAQLYGIAQMMNVSLGQLAKQIAIMSARFLANPIVAVTAALVAGYLAMDRYVSMSKDFNVALRETNNWVGVTKESFDDLASAIGKDAGTSFARGAEAMTAIARSGRISSDMFKEASVTAARFGAATGAALDDIVEKYERIARDPVQALEQLNQQEHFLSAAQWERVRALEAEGKGQQAVTEALRIYLDHQNKVSKAIEDARGPGKQLWEDTKKWVSDATTSVGDFTATVVNAATVHGKFWGSMIGDVIAYTQEVDRAKRAEMGEGIKRNFGQLGALGRSASDYFGVTEGDGLDDLRKRYAENRAQIEANRQAEEELRIARIKGQTALREYSATLDKSVARQMEEAKVKKLVEEAGLKGIEAQKRINALMAAYDAKNKEKTPKGPSDGSQSMLDRLKKQNVLNEARLETDKQLTESERLLAEATAYLAEMGNKLSKSRQDEIRSAMEAMKLSGEKKAALEREAAVKERMIRLDNTLRAQEANQNNANRMEIMGMTADSDAMNRMRRRLEIDQWYADELDKLRQSNVAKDEAERLAQEEKLKESYQRRLEGERQHQADLASMRDDWTVGWRAATNEYVRNMTDGARQTKDLMTNAFKGAEDAFVRFVTTGKFSFSDFARSIIADLARIAAQKAIAGIIGSLFPGGGMGMAVNQSISTAGSNRKSFNGNVFAGGTGLSDSSNRVVNGYRTFQFANGGVFDHNGSMAEKGAEAIMPLARDSSGRLGVKAAGNTNGSVTVNVYGADGQQDADAQANTDANGNMNIDIFLKAAAGEVANQFANRSGPVYTAAKNTFGLKPAVG
ncbi:tail tape measure protein [Stenotrophomonas phage BUCT626]|uniref:Tail tape measure protein n=1 Tax=Stenotrophomonas phage BUCT626 TaxID=2860376 RepID=A0AC61NMM5_9CAUD|nr:tail tape measure protein [Stenotrophomonas phage BUCT626]QYC96796.1 tail tape measure protein [Stenotrophomonas phage BUCT626]